MAKRFLPAGWTGFLLLVAAAALAALPDSPNHVLRGRLRPAGWQEPATDPSPRPAHVWLDINKQPLPFKNDDEVLEFLRTARPGRAQIVGKGISGVRRVEIEKDGLKARAAFRDLRQEIEVAVTPGGQRLTNFRDDYIFECAAYELARMLGLDMIPPTVRRTVNGRPGSLQMWIESRILDEEERQTRKIPPPDVAAWNLQIQVMKVFDNLIDNFDRNPGNILIDQNWKLWMIDHTRSFRAQPELLQSPKEILLCERGLWERLKNFNEQEARERLRPFLRTGEINALFARRVKLVALIEGLIRERGESEVLFRWDEPPSALEH